VTPVAALWDSLFGFSVSSSSITSLQMTTRAVLIYLAMIVLLRLAKRRFLSQVTVFDAILVIVIGSLATRAIAAASPFVATLAGMLALIVLHWLLSYLSMKSSRLRRLVSGSPVTLIRNGVIDQDRLYAEHMAGADLDEDLREHGLDDAAQVKEARLERSGKLSVVKAG